MSNDHEKEKVGTFQIDWNEHAPYWDASNDAITFNKLAFEEIEKVVNCQDLRILEIGCGTGLLIDHLTRKAKEIVAIDKADKMVEVLNDKNYPNVIPIHGTVSKNFPETYTQLKQPFDLVIAVSVCAFLPDYSEFLSKIKSLLKPSGMFIQFDWLRQPEGPEFGFDFTMIREVFESVNLDLTSISIPIRFDEGEDRLEVVMAIGK